MPSTTLPALTADEIDDLVYFTRVNEVDDLRTGIKDLAGIYKCSESDVVVAGIDPDSGNTLLHYCSANGFLDLLKLYLDKLDVKASNLTDSTLSEEQSPAGPKALSQDHLINRQNKQGNTPLHWAAYNGHLKVVELLVSCGADMWIKNASGHLAMFDAERAERSDVVRFLLLAGGREVERTGTQKQPTEEEIADLQQDGEPGPANGAKQASSGGDFVMEDANST